MSNEFRSVTVHHRLTNDIRTFQVTADGCTVISEAYTRLDGKVVPQRVQKITTTFGSRGDSGFNWNIHTAEKANNNHNLYIHRLVWAAWNNDGVMPPNGREMHIDHVDGNHKNNHFSNLELVTAEENSRRYHDKKELEAAIAAELIVLPCGDITFEPMKEAA